MTTNNDFLDVLCAHINSLGLSLQADVGYVDEQEGLALYPLPGGSVEEEDLAGTQTVKLYYEIAIKSRDQALNNATLWQINAALSQLNLNLPSQNDSYTFLSLEVAAPSLNDLDEQGFYIYLLDISARLEVERN